MSLHALVLCAILAVSFAEEALQVQTTSGTLEGVHTTHAFGEVVEFLGVPFAAPPVSDLRFMPPQPHSGWTGVRDAKQYGSACAQMSQWTGSPVFQPLKDWMPTEFGEDCLFLNIHLPGGTINRTKRLPVLVYIHGGNYFFGCSNIYRGDAFAAKQEVVIITINYRINYFGFLSTGDDRIRGNMGMLDQVQALQWIQDNIEEFGGDPDKVTLLGESAGAWCVSLHVISPKSKGLFKRAIIMSGVEYTRNLTTSSSLKKDNSIDALLGKVGCSDAADIVKCLQEVDSRQLLQSMYWQQAPIVDGDGGFLPMQPKELWESGSLNTERILAGTVRHDGEVVVRLLKETVYLDFLNGIPIDQVRQYVHNLLIWFDTSLDQRGFSENDVRLKNIIVDQYIGDPSDKLSNLLGTIELLTDSVFVAETSKALDRVRDNGGKGYLYYHTHKGTLSPSGYPIEVGPFHAEGIHYLFGIYANEELPLYNASATVTNAVARALMRSFASFANTGSPVFPDLSNTELAWPAFNENDEYVEFESNLGAASVQRRLLPRAVSFWNSVVPQLQQCGVEREENPNEGGKGNKDVKDDANHHQSGLVLIMLTQLLLVLSSVF